MKKIILLLLCIFFSNIYSQIKSITEISNISDLHSNLQNNIQKILDTWNINKNRIQTYTCLREVGCKICIIEGGSIPIFDYHAIVFVEGKSNYKKLKTKINDSLVIVKRVRNFDKTINKIYKTKSDFNVADPSILICTVINTEQDKSTVFIVF
jgi:hypothetical protein